MKRFRFKQDKALGEQLIKEARLAKLGKRQSNRRPVKSAQAF